MKNNKLLGIKVGPSKNKVGRPRKKEKVTLMAAYLLPKEKVEITKKYGSLTAGVRAHLLEKNN